VGEPNGAGILTRDWMSGGFTWTGFDYKVRAFLLCSASCVFLV